MAPRRVVVAFDGLTDVVSAYFDETCAAAVRPAPHDGLLLLEYAADGSVVGAEVLAATARLPQRWFDHPDRGQLPPEMLTELDRRLRSVWSGQR